MTDAVATRPRIRLVTLILIMLFAALAFAAVAETQLTNKTVDLSLIELRLSHNPGMAFSLGAAMPSWLTLTITCALTAGVAFYSWTTAPHTRALGQLSLAAICAGALANLFDRAMDGVVTDYFYTGWFPTFNLADAFITVGAGTLIMTSAFTSQERPR